MIPYVNEQNVLSAPSRSKVVHYIHQLRGSSKLSLLTAKRRNAYVVPYRETFSEFCTRYFVEEKVDLTMSKGSLMGLVVGLMFLGILFFLSGFLAAVHLYTPGPSSLVAALPNHDPLATPYYIPTQPTYATSSSSRMPSSSTHLPTTPQRAVVVPPGRQPSDYIMKPPYTVKPAASPQPYVR